MAQSRFARLFEPFYARIRGDIFELCRAMDFDPTWQQRQALQIVQDETYLPIAKRRKRVAIKSGQGPGKCLYKDSTIETSIGRHKIIDLVGKDFSVPSFNPVTRKLEMKRAQAFLSGYKQLGVFKLDSGQETEITPDHPVYTPSGWRNAAELAPGDLVATPRILPAGPGLEIPDAEVRYLAYIMSDGGTSGGNCSFTQMPGPVLDEFKADVAALGGGVRHVGKYDHSVRGTRPINRRWGVQGCKAVNKRIHAEFFLANARQAALFVNRFWACDGYFTKDGPEIILANKGLVQDLQALLLRFGILSRFSYKAAKFEDKTFDAWRLRVCGADNIERWRRSIGEVLGKEGSLPAPRPSNTNVDVVPVKTAEFNAIQDEMGLPMQRGRRSTYTPVRARIRDAGYRGRSYAWMSRDKFGSFCDDFGYDGEHAHLADNDIFWSKFVSYTETERDSVYDLQVDDNHNFVCDGIFVHNTTVTVIIAIWRALQDIDALVVVTAPSMKQCVQVWMAEARRLMDKADPLLKRLITCYATRIEIGGRRDWGVWTATASRPENLQGFHQTNLTFIVDEASGVAPSIIQQIKGTLSNPNSLLLMIGNPNTTTCDFYNCFTRDRELWHTLTFNAEDTARDYPHIVHPSRNRALELEYGRDSDVYRIRVLGEFPLSDPNTIMDLAAIDKCTKTSVVGCAGITEILPQSKAIAIDFARFGSDESVIVRRAGLAVVEYKIFVKREPREIVDHAYKMQHDAYWSNADCYFVPDADGMGQGVMFTFHESGRQCYEFKSQARPMDTRQFADQITEAWFNFRTLVNEGICHIPNDARLIFQLSTRQYYTTRKGHLKIETKDEWRKRLEITESPDRADAIVMAFYNLGAGAGRVTLQGGLRPPIVGSRVRRNR